MSVAAAWFLHASNKDLTLLHTRKGPDTVKFSGLNKLTELNSRLVTDLWLFAQMEHYILQKDGFEAVITYRAQFTFQYVSMPRSIFF